MDALERLSELSNTYVIMTSDHGYNLGHHRLAFGKFVFYEHSLRIPAVFSGPGIKAGSSFGFLGTNVDMAPTVLGLAGIAPRDGTDGRSVVPLLVSERTAAAQGTALPPSVAAHLRAAAAAAASGVAGAGASAGGAGALLALRNATIHEYMIAPAVTHQPGSQRRVDDWSNTWIGLRLKAGGDPGGASLAAPRLNLKYAEYVKAAGKSGETPANQVGMTRSRSCRDFVSFTTPVHT